MPVKKPGRRTYKSMLTEEQEKALRERFAKNQYLPHKEKIELAKRIGIDRVLLNKWFQRERKLTNTMRPRKKAQKKLTKQSHAIPIEERRERASTRDKSTNAS